MPTMRVLTQFKSFNITWTRIRQYYKTVFFILHNVYKRIELIFGEKLSIVAIWQP